MFSISYSGTSTVSIPARSPSVWRVNSLSCAPFPINPRKIREPRPHLQKSWATCSCRAAARTKPERSLHGFAARVCRIYTISMSKLVLLCAALAGFSAHAMARQSASASPAPQDLQGVVIPKVSCATQPDQSYALYVPSHYTREKRWPIVYAFDPFARGSMPVELMKDAAERYGYIVAGSNNSHNGLW